MKRIGMLCLTLVLLMSMLPWQICAAAEVVTGKHGDNLTWAYDPASATLTISGQGDMLTLDRNSDYPWEMFQEEARTLVVEPGITSIADYAFHYFHIKSLQLPEGLERIEAMAFYRCDKLTAVSLPAGLKTLGEKAFGDCWKLKEVVFPDTLEHIEAWAFIRCNDMEAVKLPDGLETIERAVFYECSSLTRVEFPRELKTIGYRAFAYCTSLKELVFPETLRVIENLAFFGCKGLTQVVFPEGLRVICNETFGKCVNLKDVTLPQSTYVFANAFDGCPEIPVVEQRLARQQIVFWGSIGLAVMVMLVWAILDGIHHRRRRFWKRVGIGIAMVMLIYGLMFLLGIKDWF